MRILNETEKKDDIYTCVTQSIITAGGEVRINVLQTAMGYSKLDYVELEQDEAIAAARAILKHFNATLESDQ